MGRRGQRKREGGSPGRAGFPGNGLDFLGKGLISPESIVCSRGGHPSCCVLEVPVGEDALGKLLLGPLEAGSCAPIQGVHLGTRGEGKSEGNQPVALGLLHTPCFSLPNQLPDSWTARAGASGFMDAADFRKNILRLLKNVELSAKLLVSDPNSPSCDGSELTQYLLKGTA